MRHEIYWEKDWVGYVLATSDDATVIEQIRYLPS